MKRKLLGVVAAFLSLFLLAAGMEYQQAKGKSPEDTKAELLVAVNELEQLAMQGENALFAEKAEDLRENIRAGYYTISDSGRYLLVTTGIVMLFVPAVFGYVYIAILRPFDKMKNFAEQVSAGNFDLPLKYERSNFFGAFTWAFDSMRREITKARACEKEAIENNRTVIATLSHDIKTPVASIRAYAEGLEANMDNTPEKRQKYLNVIMKKCDEVARLTNDLFLHSLADLDKLKISMETVELCTFVRQAAEEFSTEQKDIRFQNTDDRELYISADGERLLQIVENLVNNARKYAKTEIEISLTQQGDAAKLSVRDFGAGIPDADMPFIFDKFYRGRNSGKEQGSGLGLYIVRYLAEQMGGTVELRNSGNGLEAVLIFPLIS